MSREGAYFFLLVVARILPELSCPAGMVLSFKHPKITQKHHTVPLPIAALFQKKGEHVPNAECILCNAYIEEGTNVS